MNKVAIFRQMKNITKGDLEDNEEFVMLKDYKELKQQLQAYKDKEDKFKKIFDKFPYTCACGQGQQDEIESELLQILNEGSDK